MKLVMALGAIALAIAAGTSARADGRDHRGGGHVRIVFVDHGRHNYERRRDDYAWRERCRRRDDRRDRDRDRDRRDGR